MIIGIASSPQYDLSTPNIKRFVDIASSYGIKCVLEASATTLDYIAVFGGDGTMLHYAKKYVGCLPLFGVNMGSLGFLSQITPNEEDYSKLFASLLDGQYGISKRTLLNIEGTEIIALNEVFLCNSNRGRAVGISAVLDGKQVGKFIGDGVIVATPTGSTAISLSAGGSVLTADSNCFLLNPSMAMGSCPAIVYPDNRKLTLCVSRNTASLYVDGELQQFNDTSLTLIKYHKCADFVVLKDDFFHKLSDLATAKENLI